MLRLRKVIKKRLRCSGREAERYIKAGYVQVDGQVVTDIARKILPTHPNDSICSNTSKDDNDGYGSVRLTEIGQKAIRKIQSDPNSTLLFHKPVGVESDNKFKVSQVPVIMLCTKDREHPKSGRAPLWYEPSTTSTRAGPSPQQLSGWRAAGGRLHVNSSGLLVLTRSGAVASQILGDDADAKLHPIAKEYLVRVPQLTSDPSSVVEEKLRMIREGIAWAPDGRDKAFPEYEALDELLTAVRVEQIDENQVKCVLDRGRGDSLWRMFRAVQWDVAALTLVRIGKVELGDLPVGFWRYLRPKEAFR